MTAREMIESLEKTAPRTYLECLAILETDERFSNATWRMLEPFTERDAALFGIGVAFGAKAMVVKLP